MKATIKELTNVQMGYSFRTRIESAKSGGVSVIQMKDLLDDGRVCCDDLVKVDLGTVKSHHLARKGDLIFRSRGQVATSAILLEDPGTAVVSAPLLLIRVTKPDRVLPEYLNWYISQRDAQIYLASRTRGTLQKMISKESIEELEVALPDLKTQKDIMELASLAARELVLLRILSEKRERYISKILMQLAKGE